MKKINLTILTGTIATAITASALVPLAVIGLKSNNTKPVDPAIKYKTRKLNYSASPNEVDMNNIKYPLAAHNTSSSVQSVVITMPNNANFTFQYRTSGGGIQWNEWITISSGSSKTVNLDPNGYIQFLAYSTNQGRLNQQDAYLNIQFQTTETDPSFELGGNAMSLLSDTGSETTGVCLEDLNSYSAYCFYKLFEGSTGIKSVTQDFLPSSTVAIHCYESMFASCENLAIAPNLPATRQPGSTQSLSQDCYKNMFKGCDKLEVAPNLPANTLYSGCYVGMFDGCTNLKSISLAYTGNFVPAYFDSWVNNVNQNGIIYYNGSDKNKSGSEAPVNFTIYKDPYFEEQMSKPNADYREFEFVPKTTATLSGNRSKVTWPCPSSSKVTLGDIMNMSKEGKTTDESQISPKPTVSGDNEITYYDPTVEEGKDNTINPNTQLSKCPSKIEVGFGYSPTINKNCVNIYSGTTKINVNISRYGTSSQQPLYYKKSDDANWTTITSTTSLTLDARTNYLFSGNLNSTSTANYTNIKITGSDVHIRGNLMALQQTQHLVTPTTLSNSYAFYRLFAGSTGIVDINEDALPSTNLTEGCYSYMFSGCSNLTNVPKLKVTTLANSCYENMFENCSTIEKLSDNYLPSTQMKSKCYARMFYNCTSLDDVSNITLSSTSLSERCYWGMFEGCSGLKKPITNLNAQTIPGEAYARMFYGCKSLTFTPIFCGVSTRPATGSAPQKKMTLNSYACTSMFQNCSSLTDAKPLPLSDIEDANNCCEYMYANCSELVIAPCITHTHDSSFGGQTPKRAFYGMFNGCSKLCAWKKDHKEIAGATSDPIDYNSIQKTQGYVFCTDDRSNADSDDATWTNMFSGCTKAIAEGCSVTPQGYTSVKFPTWNSEHIIQSFYSYRRNPTSITLNKSSASLQPGKTVDLKVSTVAPYAAIDTVIWSSNNSSVAKVDDKGKVTALKAGTATITATSTVASGVKATCTITVGNPAITKITAKYTGSTTPGSALKTSNLIVTATLEGGGTKTLNKDEYTVWLDVGTPADITSDVQSSTGYVMPAEKIYPFEIRTVQTPTKTVKLSIDIQEAGLFDIDPNGLIKLTSAGLKHTGTLPIPEKVGTTTVTGFAENACENAAFTGIQFAVEDNIKTIKANAFKGCQNLIGFNVSTNIVEIGNNAFGGCTALDAFKISSDGKLTTIGEACFSGCTALEVIVFGTNITKVCKNAFAGCTKLKEVGFDSSSIAKTWVQCDTEVTATISTLPSENRDKFMDFTSGAATGTNWGTTGIEVQAAKTITKFTEDASISDAGLAITLPSSFSSGDEGWPTLPLQVDGAKNPVTGKFKFVDDNKGTICLSGEITIDEHTTFPTAFKVNLEDIFNQMSGLTTTVTVYWESSK